jgi:hypothetical protein
VDNGAPAWIITGTSSKGVLRSILRQAGITVEEFKTLLS